MTEQELVKETFYKTLAYLRNRTLELKESPELRIATELLNKFFLVHLAMLLFELKTLGIPLCHDFLKGIVFYALYLKHKKEREEELELEEMMKQ